MRAAPVVLALALALAAPLASAKQELTVLATDDAMEYWFEIEGVDGRNPTLALEAGEDYVIHVKNTGTMVHNLHVGGGIDAKTEMLEPGQFAALEFRVPDSPGEGEMKYWCDPHKGLLMEGPLDFTGGTPKEGSGNETEPTPDDGPEESGRNGIPAPGLLVAVAAVGLAAALRRR